MPFWTRITITIVLLAAFSYGSWSYPNCSDVQESDFRKVDVVTKNVGQILKMDFERDTSGNVDIYFVEKDGYVKRYAAELDSVMELGNLSVNVSIEGGLGGIALDPNFSKNNRIYLNYTDDIHHNIVRFTLNKNRSTLIMATKQTILQIPYKKSTWHMAGAMQFDDYGDLWISVGDNELMETGPANTADLRGKILRIHPEENGTYTIPPGNLWEKAKTYFSNLGDATTSAMYQEPSRARREVYVMGNRNSFTMTLDPVRRWLTWGECGPDYASKTTLNPDEFTEEHNLVLEPGFMGFPYLSGTASMKNNRHNYSRTSPDEVNEWGSKNPQDPLNLNSSIKGIPRLLPHTGGFHSYAHQCAMTGPIYRYDGSLESTIKFPPHFNRVWFVSDYNQRWIKAIRLADDGKSMIGQPVPIFTNMSFGKTLDFQQGPDGALYYLNYSQRKIERIEYQGSCRPTHVSLEKVGCRDSNSDYYDSTATHDLPGACHGGTSVFASKKGRSAYWERGVVSILVDEEHQVSIYTVHGKKVQNWNGKSKQNYEVESFLKNHETGLYFVRIRVGLQFLVYKYQKL